MNKQQTSQVIEKLYNAVDNKNLDFLDGILADDVNFRIGNYETVGGKPNVLAANEQFFTSITSMNHTIDKVWQFENDVLCNGVVDYIRLDGSECSAYFLTVLTFVNDKIVDYFVYVDISAL